MVKMTIKKLFVFFVFVTSVPLAYPRYASPGDQNIFSLDRIVEIHHSHSIQHEKSPKKQTKTISEKKRDTEDNSLRKLLEAIDMKTLPFKICTTTGCKNLATEFLKSLNMEVDPCDNFYEFTCGGWKTINPIPDNQHYWNRFAILSDITNRRIKNILESEPKSREILPVKQAKRWYKSCMDAENEEQYNLKSTASIMKKIGGWPMAMNEGEWHENEYNWRKVENYYANLTGSYAFYDIEIEKPVEGSMIGSINIVPPKIPLKEQFQAWLEYDVEDTYSRYVMLVMKVVISFTKYNQASVSVERSLQEIREMLLFAKALFKLSITDTSEDYFNHTSFEKLSNLSDDKETDSKIDWSSMIQGLFNIAKIKVHPSTDVYFTNEKYIEGIRELLSRTPSRTIVNYIHWYFIGQLPIMGIPLDFTTKTNRGKERWLNCVEKMNMEHAVSYMFVKKYYSRKTGKTAHEMIENIRTAMGENIDDSYWLDTESKALLKEKLNSMKTIVGFPEWYLNKTAIIDYYKGITIRNNSFGNSLSYMRFERQKYLKQYINLKSQLISHTLHLPITVTASYNVKLNHAQFPAANFQSPFFGFDLPINVKYGIVGPTIGHEMSHGFDTCGITFGKDGNETKLTEAVLESYYKRAKCFVDQFDEFVGNSTDSVRAKRNCPDDTREYEDTYGQITANENIADTTGLQAAFQAYTKFSSMKNPKGEKRLPGLAHFTDDQLFFLCFAEVWCEFPMPTLNRHDPHSRPDFRVNGAVSNSKDFATAFQCPNGSPMNPIQKCNIWNKPGDEWVDGPAERIKLQKERNN